MDHSKKKRKKKGKSCFEKFISLYAYPVFKLNLENHSGVLWSPKLTNTYDFAVYQRFTDQIDPSVL